MDSIIENMERFTEDKRMQAYSEMFPDRYLELKRAKQDLNQLLARIQAVIVEDNDKLRGLYSAEVKATIDEVADKYHAALRRYTRFCTLYVGPRF